MNFPGMNDSKYLNFILLLLSEQPFSPPDIKTIEWLQTRKILRIFLALGRAVSQQNFNGEQQGLWR